MTQTRRLAAIMFTDIVGYTAIMGRDEHLAFDMIRRNRQIQKHVIEEFNGTWIKELGDGTMSSFSSISDALQAAIKIQQTCNATKDFQLRIGIHQSEVIFENGDVFGDGVNLAARIEAQATPGGIWVSEPVHRNLANRTDIQTEYLKTLELKNVEQPVKIYQVKMPGVLYAEPESTKRNDKPGHESQSAQPKERNKKFVLSAIAAAALVVATYFLFDQAGIRDVLPDTSKSVAVLPFTNMSSDPDQAYFSDGMMDEVLNQLVKIGDLKVSSRTSSMNYRNSEKSLKQIASELDVSAIVEGSVQKSGDRIRIITQLIDAQTDKHLWSQTFDTTLVDVFGVQTEIAKRVAYHLNIILSNDEKQQLEYSPTGNSDAYEYYLRGKEAWYNSREIASLQLLDTAIMLDSDFALAYALRAQGRANCYFNTRPGSEGFDSLAHTDIERALELAPDMLEVQIGKVFVLYMIDRNYSESLAILENLKLRYPKNVDIYSTLAAVQRRNGLWRQALENHQRTVELDSNWPNYWEYARLQMAVRNYDWIIDNSHKWGGGLIGQAYIAKGEIGEAIQAFHERGDSINKWLCLGDYQKVLQRLENRGEYERTTRAHYRPRSLDRAELYFWLGQEESGLQYAEKAIGILEQRKREAPGDFTIYNSLALAYALSSDCDRAINTGNIAMQMSPFSKDAFQDGPLTSLNMARVYLLCGQYDEGMDILEYLLTVPSGGYGITHVSQNWLKFHPDFAPFRNLPRFQQILKRDYETVY